MLTESLQRMRNQVWPRGGATRVPAATCLIVSGARYIKKQNRSNQLGEDEGSEKVWDDCEHMLRTRANMIKHKMGTTH